MPERSSGFGIYTAFAWAMRAIIST